MLTNRKKLLIGVAALALVLVAWIGAFAAWLFLDPTLAQWTIIVTAAAVATEIAFWVGAVILGITALQRLRGWMRLQRHS